MHPHAMIVVSDAVVKLLSVRVSPSISLAGFVVQWYDSMFARKFTYAKFTVCEESLIEIVRRKKTHDFRGPLYTEASVLIPHIECIANTSGQLPAGAIKCEYILYLNLLQGIIDE